MGQPQSRRTSSGRACQPRTEQSRHRARVVHISQYGQGVPFADLRETGGSQPDRAGPARRPPPAGPLTAPKSTHLGTVPRASRCFPEVHLRTTTRPAGLPMTELQADVSVAARLHEGGSLRRALRPAIQDRYPPPAMTVLSAVVEDAQRSTQPGGGGPDAQRLVARDDLVARLDRSAARKVTVLSAPAGSGKTSLLRAWAARPGRAHRVVFVPVRQGEQDTQVFWLALLSAVRQACGATGDEPSAATPGFNGRAMADRVLSELAGCCGRVVVVIDDVHELNSPGALAQLTRLLADLPPHAHAIVSTRHDLLLRTCLLDRVNGELADLLTGRPGSEQILLDLEDANAFVESTDPGRTWFRYHHLFADFLRLELRRTLPGQVPTLHRRAAEWFIRQGQVAEAVRHTQAAGAWADAARLLADQSLSLMLDGQAQTIQALLRAFPTGADHPELALVRAMGDLAQGRLDQAAAHLAVAERHAETTLPDRRRRLGVAVASLQLALARRRGDLAGVIEHARFLDSPVSGESDEDIALGSDLRAVALMNLGTAEAWTLGQPDAPDAERHLREGADLARKIGRPYVEVGCLAQLGFASLVLHSFATTQRRCREAIALAERYGWGTEPVIAPALIMLAGTLIWTGEFDEGERWLRRTRQALQTYTGPDITLLLHQTAGILHAGRGRHHEAFEELSAAEQLGSKLEGSQ